MQGLRTGVWVAVITVLIWVYADIHFTAEEDVEATLHILTSSADNIVLLSPNDASIKFRVKGKRNFIDRFMDSLSGQKSVLRYDPARALGAGQHRELISKILTDLPELRDFGLEVVWTGPRDIDIHLDRLKDIRDIPVKPDFSDVVPSGPVEVKPDRVDLRIPESQKTNIGSEKQLTVLTKPITLGDDVAIGESITREVELLPPPNISNAILIPNKVTVTFKIGQRTDSKVFTVAVAVQSPRSWLTDGTWSKYELQAKPGETWTRQITVTGNRIDLEKLGLEKIQAYIVLTDSDLKPLGSWLPGEVKVQLPPDLKVRLADESVLPVSYRLEKRTVPPPLP